MNYDKIDMLSREPEGEVLKGWGSEQIWVSNDHYCSKFLHFNAGACFSMHFHAKKIETWYVVKGTFKLVKINTSNASEQVRLLTPGSVVHNDVLEPHQLFCITGGTILEVSTPDSIEDNYRVRKGDSQHV